MLGLSEEQLWQMSFRTFHNMLQGRNYKLEQERFERQQQDIRHQELVLAVLSPHLKKGDREKAYRELETRIDKLKGGLTPKEKKPKKTGKEFWEELDRRSGKKPEAEKGKL